MIATACVHSPLNKYLPALVYIRHQLSCPIQLVLGGCTNPFLLPCGWLSSSMKPPSTAHTSTLSTTLRSLHAPVKVAFRLTTSALGASCTALSPCSLR